MATAPAWLVPTLIGAGILGTVGAIAWAMSEPEPRGGVRSNPSLLAAEEARIGSYARRCPTGSKVRSLLFPRRLFTTTQAKAWARGHGFKAGKPYITDRYIHLQQRRGPAARVRTVAAGRSGVLMRVGWTRC